jgi:hypothetical protein
MTIFVEFLADLKNYYYKFGPKRGFMLLFLKGWMTACMRDPSWALLPHHKARLWRWERTMRLKEMNLGDKSGTISKWDYGYSVLSCLF